MSQLPGMPMGGSQGMPAMGGAMPPAMPQGNPHGGAEMPTCPLCQQPLPMPFNNTDAMNKPMDVGAMLAERPAGAGSGGSADQSALIRAILGGGAQNVG